MLLSYIIHTSLSPTYNVESNFAGIGQIDRLLRWGNVCQSGELDNTKPGFWARGAVSQNKSSPLNLVG